MDSKELAGALVDFVGQVVLYGGGAVAISFAAFKAFGEKWLDARFSERLQSLKTAQDEQLRHAQSYIDREIHRARKLYDREFDTLPEAWSRLCAALDDARSTAWEQYPNLARHTEEELVNRMSATTMQDFEKQDLLSLPPEDRTEYFRRWLGIQSLNQCLESRRHFLSYVKANAVFFSAGLKEKFLALDSLIGPAVAEFQGRLEGGPGSRDFQLCTKLIQESTALQNELETLIHGRLWSSDAAKSQSVT